ncbi:MAG: sigma 54-interacting transcriptional regulator [Planctomycetes bacterium]|nr:sigma 54-interacting transcriptional regulator [Planctomycetota bacterium]
MKAENLRLDEVIRFSRGLVDLKGRRLIIHDLYALGQFRRDIIEMVGWDQARRIFTRFGYFWGHADAAAMKRIFTWDSLEEWVKAGPVLHMLQGLAEVELEVLALDGDAGTCHLECAWKGSGEAQAHVEEMGLAESAACWIQTGYASGYASFCLGKSVYFVETACLAKGDPTCRAVGRDIDSWGEAVQPHLGFFHADDIKGKIQKLTQQLRRKDLLLARQQDRLEKVLQGTRLASVEVRSPRFQRILDAANRVAKFDSSVLITGETGTGKEVLARHIHGQSPRAAGPFLAINCAALPETLLESELFGHRKGAFTGAVRDQPGLFEEARGGAVFLDEIGEATRGTQSKFLRVLQEKEVLRVGENRPRKVDVRVMAATNRDLEKAVAGGAFREDLFYRLQVFRIEVPPLRERREDILPLARLFVEKCGARLGLSGLRLDPACLDCLLDYAWPGNVRELENAIEHAAILCSDNTILQKDLPAAVAGRKRAAAGGAAQSISLQEVELDHIQTVLEQAGGNRKEAARILGIGIATLYRRLRLLRARPGSTASAVAPRGRLRSDRERT